MSNMTVLTGEMFEQAQRIESIDEAMHLLLSYEHFRTLGDVLTKFFEKKDLKAQLSAGLQLWFPEDKPDSIDRKVRNWLNGKTQSVSKQDAYILCRIMNLSLEKTGEFLMYATGESIHWRNPEDIIWCYSIIHEMRPDQIKALHARAQAVLHYEGKPDASSENHYTAEVFQKLQPVLYLDENALLAFLEEERDKLGIFHNTAYHLFSQYMGLLKKGYSDTGVEALYKEMTKEEKKKALIPVDGDIGLHKAEPITVRDVLETYMYRKLVPVQTRGKAKTAEAFSSIQRNIRQNWPDEFSLSKMESRKLDISRKALILLFLATDGSDSEYFDDEEEYIDSAEEMFLSIYTRLNVMLSSCGFPLLDPRNPFDWIILFCISTGDLWESDARLQEILLKTYPADS